MAVTARIGESRLARSGPGSCMPVTLAGRVSSPFGGPYELPINCGWRLRKTGSMHPLDAQGAVPLAVVERSGFPESRHLGAAVVLGPDGDRVAAHGDVDALV